MNKMKNYSKIWLIPLLLVMIMAGCEDRVGITSTLVIPYTVTLSSSPSAGGSTSGGGTFNTGSSVTVTATPNSGYTFTNWKENGVVVTSSISYQFSINGNRTLVANFTAVAPTQYTITLLSNPLAGGTTSGGGAFNSASSVTLTATPNAGYTFTNWTENGTAVSTNASYTFTISGNRTLVANFTAGSLTQYTITLSSNPSAGGTTNGGGTFNSGSSVTVTATTNAGYIFNNWTENGIVVTSSISYQFTIGGNRTLVANFTAVAPTQYTITLLSNPSAGGTTNGGGAFNSGSSVTVTATPNSGYTFTNWTENGNTVSTNASYTFTISGNRTLVANFASAGTGGQAPVNLGTAARFGLLSNSAITNIPTSAITGDIGISPGARSSITGFVLTPDASNTFSTSPEVTGKVFAANDAVPTPAMLIAAKNDAQVAYLDATAAVRGTPTPISGNINGLTLVPGLYESGTSIQISPGGFLYLDAQGNSNAVFVIRSATSITTEATSEVVLTNGAQAANIYWSAGSAVTLGTNSKMKGTIIASTSISLLTGARLDGRALIQGPAAGQVSLDHSIIVKP
ncbi:MAG: ice-binding family protein [Ignavibacteriales bacterium]|nr:ice-binding family protein [Ignavibacteriales bacterium]